MQETITFSSGKVSYYFESTFDSLCTIVPLEGCVVITDSNVAALYRQQLAPFKKIIIPAGEEHKNIQTIITITEELIQYEAHRKTWIIGIGGGVVTDIAGWVAAIYMRGVPFGFVPTSLLGMVDASIGGKNGIDFGLHKNLLGTIRQPQFILQDVQFLETLPGIEWSNGFAEIIKYACIFDPALFDILEQHNIDHYKQNKADLNKIIAICTGWKNKTVLADETETGLRKLLNFGHTAGHAIETVHQLPHGQAIALGMLIACILSEQVAGLSDNVRPRLVKLLQAYGLPTAMEINIERVMEVLRMDKKRNNADIDFIVLEKNGVGAIKKVSFHLIHQAIITFNDAGNN